MTMLKRLLPAQISALNDDEVEVVMSTGTIARDGHILVPQGAKLDNYRANPVFLFQHNADIPVARASDIRVSENAVTCKVTFAPLGVSPDADKVRGLVKSGIISAVSVGFDPIEGEPLDPKRPYAGKRFTEWELLECSFVSVPADTGAVVTAREHEREAMTERTETPAAILTRGLYEVSDLACLLSAAGYLQSWVAMEAEWEGDGSQVPAKFLAVLKDLGAVLVEMTIEEVAELFEGDAGERTIGILKRAKERAGKKVSKATKAQIQTAIDHHERGLDLLREMCRDDDDEGGEMAHEAGATREAGDGGTAGATREVMLGVVSVNEARQAAGLPPLESLEVGTLATIETRTTIAPPLTDDERAAFVERIRKLKDRSALHARYVTPESVEAA